MGLSAFVRLGTALLMQKFAIYDMDKTITRRATFPGFLRFAGLRIAPVRQLLWQLVGLFLLGYALKLVSRGRLKELMHGALLGPRLDPARLAQVAEDFFFFRRRPLPAITHLHQQRHDAARRGQFTQDAANLPALGKNQLLPPAR